MVRLVRTYLSQQQQQLIMNFDINHLVRSAAIAAVGLPLALSTSGLINTTAGAAEQATTKTGVQTVYSSYGDKLAEPCIGWAVSKVDTKLERESKNAIDEIFGGEVDYSKVCNAFVF
jgi:hypothetical protein